jgi:predicted RNA-binding Zn-ribbon protein involved in translation (DUF1610 family)
MGFSKRCIELEFEEAARLGRRNHTAQVERWEADRWFYEVGFENLRPKPVPIQTVAVERFECPRCGATCERREGTRRVFHMTKSNACGGKKGKIT